MSDDKYRNALPLGSVLVSPAQDNQPTTRYVIREVLGTGGFGITYKALTQSNYRNLKIDIIVAIKEHFVDRNCQRHPDGSVTATESYADIVEDSRKAFYTEARRLSKISGRCPNIICVNEVFDANGTSYYVMEYLEGQTLADYIKQCVRNNGRPLTWDEARPIFLPLAKAVGFLHDNRVLHQDIKPANVMLCLNEEDRLYPKLIDFGLSKHFDKDGMPTSTIHIAGYSEGYAPPEQYMGIRRFAPTVDIYALAATLFYMLSGYNPRNASDFTPDDIRQALRPYGVVEGIQAALIHAMAYNGKERTQSVEAFAQELDGETKSQDDDSTKWRLHPKTESLKEKVKSQPTQKINSGPTRGGEPITEPVEVKPKSRKWSKEKWVATIIGGCILLGAIADIVTNCSGNNWDNYRNSQEKVDDADYYNLPQLKAVDPAESYLVEDSIAE